MVGDDPEPVRREILNNMKGSGEGEAFESDPVNGLGISQGEEKRVGGETPLMAVKASAIRHIEELAIIHALNLTNWNKKKAARLLKISYKALFYKMASLEIDKKSDVHLEA